MLKPEQLFMGISEAFPGGLIAEERNDFISDEHDSFQLIPVHLSKESIHLVRPDGFHLRLHKRVCQNVRQHDPDESFAAYDLAGGRLRTDYLPLFSTNPYPRVSRQEYDQGINVFQDIKHGFDGKPLIRNFEIGGYLRKVAVGCFVVPLAVSWEVEAFGARANEAFYMINRSCGFMPCTVDDPSSYKQVPEYLASYEENHVGKLRLLQSFIGQISASGANPDITSELLDEWQTKE